MPKQRKVRETCSLRAPSASDSKKNVFCANHANPPSASVPLWGEGFPHQPAPAVVRELSPAGAGIAHTQRQRASHELPQTRPSQRRFYRGPSRATRLGADLLYFGRILGEIHHAKAIGNHLGFDTFLD